MAAVMIRAGARLSLCLGFAILTAALGDYAWVDGLGTQYLVLMLVAAWLLGGMLTPGRPAPVRMRRKPADLRKTEHRPGHPQPGGYRGDQRDLPTVNLPLIPGPDRHLDHQVAGSGSWINHHAHHPTSPARPCQDGPDNSLLGSQRNQLVLPAGHPAVPPSGLSHDAAGGAGGRG